MGKYVKIFLLVTQRISVLLSLIDDQWSAIARSYINFVFIYDYKILMRSQLSTLGCGYFYLPGNYNKY